MKKTMKEIKKMYKNTIEIGYCELWDLLKLHNRKFYTSGIYGWNADIYEINYNTAIITGYRSFGNIKPSYKLVEKYNKQAKELIEKENDFEKLNGKLNELIEKFIKECLKEE